MSPARARLLRLLVLLALLVQQLLIHGNGWRHDPFARHPIEDAAAAWAQAGAFARGDWIGEEPFLSAPLYPVLLGGLRCLGAGIPAVTGVQVLLHLATAWLLGRIAGRWLGPGGGWLAMALYGLLTGPAWETGRLLNGPLQLFLTVLLWDRLESAAAPPRRGPLLLAGALAGLLVLANPPMLAALPVLALWLARPWRSPAGPRPALQRLLLVAAPALLVLAPATVHNWLATGEPILVSAQAGVTFYHGNAPGAVGVYQPIPGISADRQRQNRDAYAVAAEATGEAGWRSTSRYFLGRGLSFWAGHPGEAAVLLARKAWWLAAGIVYGDIYMPVLEREDGSLPWLWLAPVPEALVVLPGLAGLLLLRRRRRSRALPAILLAALPCLVVLVFWYTPRYRMPAVPILVVAALAGARMAARRELPGARAWMATAAAGALLLPLAGRAVLGLDDPATFRPAHEAKAGTALLRGGEPAAAESRLRRSLELRPHDPATEAALAESLRRQGRGEEALDLLLGARDRAPEDPRVRRTLGFVLAGLERWAEAEAEFRAALDADPGDLPARDGLGSCLFARGRLEEAAVTYREVLEAAPDSLTSRKNLAAVLQELRRYEEAVGELRRVLAIQPADLPSRLRLAWLLATAVGPAEDGGQAAREALEVARAAATETGGGDPAALETLAAAQAASGDFSAAVETQQRALDRLRALGAVADLLAAARERLALYRSRRAYRMPR